MSTSKRFLPGDWIGFSSWSLRPPLGVAINLFTWGVPFWGLSHIAVVTRHPDHPWPLLFEATTRVDEPCVVQGYRMDGAQYHKIERRIATYRGLVWHYPLALPLCPGEVRRLAEFCDGLKGRSYDAIGAVGARDTLSGRLARRGVPEDLTSLFCSEVAVACDKISGRAPLEEVSSVYSPNRATRRAVWWWRSHLRPTWVKRWPCPYRKESRDAPVPA